MAAAEEEMKDESRRPRSSCWMRRCCWGSQEEQEEEKVEEGRRWDGRGSGQDELEVEELRVEEACLRKSRSSSSLPLAEV